MKTTSCARSTLNATSSLNPVIRLKSLSPLMAATLALLAASSGPRLLAETKSGEVPIYSDTPIGAGIPIFDISKLDRIPVVKHQTPAEYPMGMRQASIEGEVLVDFVVNTEGKVVNAVAVRSSRREFEVAAVAAVRKWKFQPGLKGGRVVNTHMQVPIGFALRQD